MSHDDKKKLEEYITGISDTIVSEFFRLADEEVALHGPEVSKQIILNVVCSVLATLVNQTLIADPKHPHHDAEHARNPDDVIKEFLGLKGQVESVVAKAFNVAFENFKPGERPGYECEIYFEPPSRTEMSQ